jgi:hypothetical protein
VSCPVCWGLGTCVHLRVLGSCKVDGRVSRVFPVPSTCKRLLFPLAPPFHAQASNTRPAFPAQRWTHIEHWNSSLFPWFVKWKTILVEFVSFLSSSFILVKTVYYSSTWASSWIVDYFINFQKLNSIFICMWFLYWMCVEYGILPEAYGC